MARVSLELSDPEPLFMNYVGGCADVPFWGKGLIPSFLLLPGKGLYGQLGYTSEQRGPAEYITYIWAVRGVIPFSRGGKWLISNAA